MSCLLWRSLASLGEDSLAKVFLLMSFDDNKSTDSQELGSEFDKNDIWLAFAAMSDVVDEVRAWRGLQFVKTYMDEVYDCDWHAFIEEAAEMIDANIAANQNIPPFGMESIDDKSYVNVTSQWQVFGDELCQHKNLLIAASHGRAELKKATAFLAKRNLGWAWIFDAFHGVFCADMADLWFNHAFGDVQSLPLPANDHICLILGVPANDRAPRRPEKPRPGAWPPNQPEKTR